ncbi:MAG: hypothetical protein Q8O35_01955 [Humidesulfovibrio sp.]|jgi:hypothetical protein|uniref:hypothetical protein n=1 Tax=Humidesulfovibrio sp. TaxID=2910988 RepID=UPI002734E499|nr:hypothetical protein [Humidesulfovibrio sp.]MDP2846938.1 hypothetical protein [Humidesulfovibrio sp.]
MKRFAIVFVVLASLFTGSAFAQDMAAEEDMKALVKEIKADKRLLVRVNMRLNEKEDMAFWPVYDAYQKDLESINKRIVKVVASYLDAYGSGTMSDATATKITKEVLSIETDEVALRKNCASKLGKVVSASTVARYLQIEGKIRAVIRYELARQIPMVPSAK